MGFYGRRISPRRIRRATPVKHKFSRCRPSPIRTTAPSNAALAPAANTFPPNGGVLPNGAPVHPQQIAVAPPYALSPQQQSELDQVLSDWEKKNSEIRTFECKFTRLEYDPTFISDPLQAKTECHGEIKYAAPDKGSFRVTDAFEFVADPAKQTYNKTSVAPTEWWTCDGKSMFEVNYKAKQIVEQPIPPELQGKAISEGPLPFVFGAKADALRKRYFMQIITPPQFAKDQVWLEARPKTQKDAANFSKVELILTKPDLQPYAIQIFNPGANAKNPMRTMIKLEDPSVNSPWAVLANWLNNFARPTIIGYAHVVAQPQVPPPNSSQSLPDQQKPVSNSGSMNQASRPKALRY